MSHEITTTLTADGRQVSHAAFEIPAWHRLGAVVGRKMQSFEALQFANLHGWDVRKVPLWADLRQDEAAVALGSKHAIGVPEQYATIFTDPVTNTVKTIGVVGDRYTPIQWEDVAEFGDAILETEEEALITSLGSLNNYRKGFISIKLPQTMVLEGKDGQLDVTEYYLTLLPSFDGSSSLIGLISTVRVVCANTARAAIAGAISKFSIRHTSGWRANAAEARNALKLSVNYSVAFEEIVRTKLQGVAMSVDEMKGFAADLTRVNDTKESTHHQSAFVKRTDTMNHIVKLFIESPSIKGTAIEGTRFAAYNAVTQFADHEVTGLRGGSGKSEAELGVLRATRSILNMAVDTQTDIKADAWRLLTTV